MVFRARLRGTRSLVVLAALAATMAAVPFPSFASTRPVVHAASASTKHRVARRHRVRRPPPGGVYARNAVVMDPTTGEILFEKNGSAAVPIASLTKLMTAIVFLE